MDRQRSLRMLSLFASTIATPLLIALAIVGGKQCRYYYCSKRVSTWDFSFIAVAVSIVTSIVSLGVFRRHGRLPGGAFHVLDLFGGVVYLGLLIPIWATEIGHLGAPGLVLLGTYSTVPMILNMFIHFYFFALNIKSVGKSLYKKAETECPNCHSRFIKCAPKTQETTQRTEGYSLLRGEDYLDADATAYADVRTSEDEIGVQAEHEAEHEIEDKGKGAIKL